MRTLKEIQNEIMEDNHNFFSDMAYDLEHHVLGLCGEAGEVADLVKKRQRRSPGFTESNPKFTEALETEVVDVFIYIMSIAAILEMDMEKEYDRKRAYNRNRFGPQGIQKSLFDET